MTGTIGARAGVRTAGEATTTPAIATAGVPARVAELSYFFPAHNEEANLAELVAEALDTLPSLAERFEIVIVDDGSRDRTPALADALVMTHPDIVRVVHHPTNYGYGAALRSGFRASRFALIGFTQSDRQFKVADHGRLTARNAEGDPPDEVLAAFWADHDNWWV